MTNARNAWMGNEAWPSNRSCGDFARDVFRLSGAQTDKQKALAFYSWFTRCMMRGPNLSMPNGAGGYSRCYEPLLLLTGWGHGECTFWGWTASECLNAAGLKTRRVVVHNNGHTYYEVWYAGDDGVEQWHAFDPFGGWYFLNENGEVASCAQLAANPRLVQQPLPGHPVPLGHHPERSSLAHRHRTEDQVFIEQPLRGDVNAWELNRGMEVTCTFMPEAPGLALFTRHPGPGESPDTGYPDGSHCDITPYSKLGMLQQAEHLPYWENYLWPTPVKNHINEGRPVRWHGAGALRWKPLSQGEDATWETHNAKFENGSLLPTGSHDFTEVWYRFRLPFPVSYIALDYDVVGSGGDYWGFALSTDGGRTQWPLRLQSNAPHYGSAINGQAEWKAGKPSVQGLREFWLRIDMFSHSPTPRLAMRALDITVGFQHNMHLQPRLLPGENKIWLEAGEPAEGTRLQADWAYLIGGEQREESLVLEDTPRVERTVNVAADSPRDIRMTAVKLRCLNKRK